jgi:adenylate cyclase
MGIGMHTRVVVLGDIGAPRRRDYTVVGDAVNVAARLQELTKQRQVPVLVSEATRVRLADAVRLAPAGTAAIRGRVQTLAIHIPDDGTSTRSATS